MRLKSKNYPYLECNDGFRVSIQASEGKYCEPPNNVGPYVSVELGFPSERDELILPWAENPSEPTKSVYGWVPTQVVFELIGKHGGCEPAKMAQIPPMVLC